MNEHGFEPSRGLPGQLPDGERLLWQGAPQWWSFAQRALHVRKLAIYFAVLLAWYAATEVSAGALEASRATVTMAGIALVPLALVVLFSWVTARMTVYTITDKRVVIRFGIALPATVNLPFRMIESAGLRIYPEGTADLPLVLADGERIAYMLMWPHARPWRWSRAEPMLRAVPDGARVGQLLARALAASADMPAQVGVGETEGIRVPTGRKPVAAAA